MLGWVRTDEWAVRARTEVVLGSRSSSQGIVAASVTPERISIRVSGSRSSTRLQILRASSFAWNTALNASQEGWWLDPKDAKFGPNAKYFQHNPAEAKKLLAAAGYANGFEIPSTMAGIEYPPSPCTTAPLALMTCPKTSGRFDTIWSPGPRRNGPPGSRIGPDEAA